MKSLTLIVAAALFAGSCSTALYNGHSGIYKDDNNIRAETLSGEYAMPPYIFEGLRKIARIMHSIGPSEELDDGKGSNYIINIVKMVEDFTPDMNPKLWSNIMDAADENNDHNIDWIEYLDYYGMIHSQN